MKKFKVIGEGGIYNGMARAQTNEVEIKGKCYIHITQSSIQTIKVEILKESKVIKELSIKGNKWIKLLGNGSYRVRLINNKKLDAIAGISILKNISKKLDE